MKTSIFAFVTLVIFSISFSAFAETHKVFVQCNVAGPVYEGVLNGDLQVANWKPTEDCRSDMHGETSERKMEIPGWSLKFNNVEYISKEGVFVNYWYSGSCESEKAAHASFKIEEVRSGLVMTRADSRVETGRLPNNLKFFAGTSFCIVRVVD